MKHFFCAALAAALMLGTFACTTGGTGGGPGGSSAKTVLFKVNGRSVTAEEFISAPMMRTAIGQFIFFQSLRDEARKAGAKPDEAKVKQQVEDQKKQAELSFHTSWANLLKQQGLTEEDILNQARDMQLMQALVNKRLNLTDADLKKEWDKDKDSIISEYASKNKLPDSEKSKITFEQAKDAVKDRLGMIQGQSKQAEVGADIILDTTFEMLAVSDKAKAKQIEDLIINNRKESAKKQKDDLAKAAQRQPNGAAQPGGGLPAGNGAPAPPPGRPGAVPPAGKPGAAPPAPPAKPGAPPAKPGTPEPPPAPPGNTGK